LTPVDTPRSVQIGPLVSPEKAKTPYFPGGLRAQILFKLRSEKRYLANAGRLDSKKLIRLWRAGAMVVGHVSFVLWYCPPGVSWLFVSRGSSYTALLDEAPDVERRGTGAASGVRELTRDYFPERKRAVCELVVSCKRTGTVRRRRFGSRAAALARLRKIEPVARRTKLGLRSLCIEWATVRQRLRTPDILVNTRATFWSVVGRPPRNRSTGVGC